MRTRFVIILSFVFSATAAAQELNAPPVTTFKPDTSLPKVNLPEFVITGRSQMELPVTDKPTILIDSSFFGNRELQGYEYAVPLDRSFNSGDAPAANGISSLFAHASYGHYTTADYLFSGVGSYDGYLINAAFDGNYTSGFIPLTVARRFSAGGGVSKDLVRSDAMDWNSSLDLAYARSSYFLYGESSPGQLRETSRFRMGLNSDLEISGTPVMVGFGFDRFSLSDIMDNVEAVERLQAGTRLPLLKGGVNLNVDFDNINHTVDHYSGPVPLTADSLPAVILGNPPEFEKLTYFLKLGAGYDGAAGPLSYILDVNYFQYSDDNTSSVAKIYPDLKFVYRFGDSLSFFAGISGDVRQASLLDFVAADRYVNSYIPLVSSQRFPVFNVGANISIIRDLTLTPQFTYEGVNGQPIYATVQTNSLFYLDRTKIYTFSIDGRYVKNDFDGTAGLQFETGSADSISRIPNVPLFTGDISGTYHFMPSLSLEGNFTLLSSRYADLALRQKLNSVDLLGLRLSYSTHISVVPFEFYIEGKNLLNQKYYVWQNYQEFPLSLFVGINCRLI